MGGAAFAFGFLTDPVHAVHDRGGFRGESEIDGNAVFRCPQMKGIGAGPFAFPVADPGQPAGIVETGFPEGTAHGPLKVAEFFVLDIRQREMGERNVPHDKMRRGNVEKKSIGIRTPRLRRRSRCR